MDLFIEPAPACDDYHRVYVVTRGPYSPVRGRRVAIIIGESLEEARTLAEKFVSAPELAEALEALLVGCRHLGGPSSDVLAAARAALAKATRIRD